MAFLTDSAGLVRLLVQAIDGGEPLELTRAERLHRPHWSRDGSEVRFYWNPEGPIVQSEDALGRVGVYAIPRLGGEPRLRFGGS